MSAPHTSDGFANPEEYYESIRLPASPDTAAARIPAPDGVNPAAAETTKVETTEPTGQRPSHEAAHSTAREFEKSSYQNPNRAALEADEKYKQWKDKWRHLFERGTETLDSFEPGEIEFPWTDHKFGRPNITQDVYSLLAGHSPPFFCHAEDITPLNSPKEFYEELLNMVSKAEKRICFSALYLGTGPMEKRLLDAINKRMYEKPSLCTHFLFDYARSHRKDKDGRTVIQPIRELIAQHPTHCSAALIHAPRVFRSRIAIHSGFSGSRPYSIKKRLFERLLMYFQSPKMVELGGVHHMKYYIVDDTVIISGANLSEIYFTNREDRYIKVRHPALCDAIVQTTQVLSLGPNSSVLSLDHEMRARPEDTSPSKKEMPYYQECRPTYTGPQPVGPEEAALLDGKAIDEYSTVEVKYVPETQPTPAFARAQAAARAKLVEARGQANKTQGDDAKPPEASDVVDKFLEKSKIASLPESERQKLPASVVRNAMVTQKLEPDAVNVPVAAIPHNRPNSSEFEINPAYPLTSIPKEILENYKHTSKPNPTSHTHLDDANFWMVPSAPTTTCPPELIKDPPKDPRPFVKARVRLPLVEPLYDRWQIGVPRYWLFNPDFGCSGTVEYRQPGVHKMYASKANVLHYDEFDPLTPIDNATFFINSDERKQTGAIDYSGSRPYWEDPDDKHVVRPGIQARFSDDEPALRFFMRTEGRLNFRTENFQYAVLASILASNYRLIQTQYENWFKSKNSMFPNPVDHAALPKREGEPYPNKSKQPDTVIFPLLQIANRGVMQDELATSIVLKTIRMRCLAPNTGYAALNPEVGMNLPLHEDRNVRKPFPLLDPKLVDPNKSLFKFEENTRKVNINLCTGYFNLADTYASLLEPILEVNDRNSLNIVVASKQANGWFDAKGIQKYVPDFYTAIAERFLRRFKRFGERVTLREYWRKGWSYHAKGMWIQEFDSAADDKANEGRCTNATSLDPNVPLIHFMGSSNFGDRSIDRDQEMQFCMITTNPDLIKKMDADLQRSMEHSKPRPPPVEGLFASFKAPEKVDERFPEADPKAKDLTGWKKALITFLCKSALFRSLL